MRADRIAGLVLIAPAPDFTIDLIEPNLTEAHRRDLAEKGYFEEGSDYLAEPNRFSQAFLDDGRANRVMDGIIETHCPVHILQGMQDADVPYQHALKLAAHFPKDSCTMSLIPGRRPPAVAATGSGDAGRRYRVDTRAAFSRPCNNSCSR